MSSTRGGRGGGAGGGAADPQTATASAIDARSEQLAADMQYAFDLQAAEEIVSAEFRHQELVQRQQQEQQQQQQQRVRSPPRRNSRSSPSSTSQQQHQHQQQQQSSTTTYSDHHHRQLQQQQQRQQQQQQQQAGFGLLSGAIPLLQGRLVRARSEGHAANAVEQDGFQTGSSEGKSLLYVACEINDRVAEMMVDTGAQSSVISASMMRTLGLQRRLNTRMAGVAAGVGAARILGVIEKCPVQIGHVEFLLYFLVLDVPQDMMILGIDQMRRFKCMIDMEENKLIFGGKDGVAVEFLPPDVAREKAMLDSNCSVS